MSFHTFCECITTNEKKLFLFLLTVSSCQSPVASARQLSSVPRTVSDFLGDGRGRVFNYFNFKLIYNLNRKTILSWNLHELSQPLFSIVWLPHLPLRVGAPFLHIKWNKVLSAQKPPWPQLISSYTFQPNPISSRTKTPKRAHRFAPPPMNIFEPYPLVPRGRVVLTSLASSAAETICPKNYFESPLSYIDFQYLMPN